MTRLLPGDLAPTFEAHSFGGGTLKLEDKLARGRVWLAFFRFASCPLCNLRLHELAEVWPNIESDIQMVAVFHSPHESIDRWLTDKRPPIDVVMDPEGDLYRLYGTEKRASAYVSATMPLRFIKATLTVKQTPFPSDGARTQVPADFLIAMAFSAMSSTARTFRTTFRFSAWRSSSTDAPSMCSMPLSSFRAHLKTSPCRPSALFGPWLRCGFGHFPTGNALTRVSPGTKYRSNSSVRGFENANRP